MPKLPESKTPQRSGARRVAFEILLRVERQASFATELLNSALTAKLAERDAALCTELVLGTLRWQGRLDFLWKQFLSGHPEKLDPEVRIALRLGMYQLVFLCTPGRMPPRAAIYETVELVKASGKRSAAGMVNAVLRKALAIDFAEPFASQRPPAMSEQDWLAIEHSHPKWLLENWERDYGYERTLSIALANNLAPPTFLRIASSQRSPTEVEDELAREGIKVVQGTILADSRVAVSGNITRTGACRSGDIVIQDEASQIVPHLLDVRPGDRVLDLCAAPGNKTGQIAQSSGPSGVVIASDLHLSRLKRIKTAGWRQVHVAAVDGTRPLPFRGTFDRILVDAPCSGTGTLRRHPEIKWRLRPEDIGELSKRQMLLLSNAAPLLRAGGRLVYSTCSLERDENQNIVERFLATNPEFSLITLRQEAERLQGHFCSSARPILQNDFLQTFPTANGPDGFFAAILLKVQT